MPSRQTIESLLRHGLDLKLAKRLSGDGYTVTALRKTSEEKLARLGLTLEQRTSVRGGRPPVPIETLHRLLFESRNTCCLCRGEKSDSVIVHHIRPWAETHSHDECNLIVLCLSCHGEAHTRRELSRNLTPELLEHAKAQWLDRVRSSDLTRIFRPTYMTREGLWDYFNFGRLHTLFEDTQQAPSECRHYESLVEARAITHDGVVAVASRPEARWRIEDLLHPQHAHLLQFYGDRILSVLDVKRWLNIGAYWSAARLATLCEPGSLFVDSGAYYFRGKAPTRSDHGTGQVRRAYRQAGDVRISGVLDAFDSLSMSAYFVHLRGRRRVTVVGFIRDAIREKGKLLVEVTYLAIGSGFAGIRRRSDSLEALIATKEAERDAIVDDSEDVRNDPAF